MGFFSLLFGRPVYTDAPVFGRLQRDDLDKRTGAAWFCTDNLLFAPTGGIINCCIETSTGGPTKAQQAFFKRIEQSYDELVAKLVPMFEETFRYWAPGFRIRNFAAEFQLTDISIPIIAAEQNGPIAWDWSFNTVHDNIHTFTVYMHDDVPEPGIQMDG